VHSAQSIMKRFVQYSQFHNKHLQKFLLAGTCSLVLVGNAYAKSTEGVIEPGIVKTSLPSYSWAEVQRHDDLKKGVWVTYKDGVYDVTKFVYAHPGQEKILMAAGNMIDGFWKFYGMHHTQEVYSLLENYRIGNLAESDRGKWKDVSGPYTEDPKNRDERLIVHSKTPFIAECPNEYLTQSYYTPNELFYVRNHSPVPKVDPEMYDLSIGGLGFTSDSDDDDDDDDASISMSLSDLKNFKKHEVDSVIQCGGNRRAELAVEKAIRGSKWKIGALCNAKWGGAKLCEVLEKAGITEEKARELGVKHVHFEAMDWGADEPYGASIPIERALDPRKDVLLAYEMNGVDLPPDHGYPVRIIAPGVVGARNVKWVCRIELSNEEYHGHYQRKAYKTFSPSQGWDDLDWAKFEAIQEMPVQSGITTPAPNSTISKGESVLVEGVAWSGNGAGIIRVDVSVDGGKTWKHANLKRPDQPRYREYAWTQWNIEYPLTGDETELDIVCKAVDTSHNVQPETIDGIFNLRGYCGNSWHRIKVKCTDLPPQKKGWFS